VSFAGRGRYRRAFGVAVCASALGWSCAAPEPRSTPRAVPAPPTPETRPPRAPARTYTPRTQGASHYRAAPLRPEVGGRELDDFRHSVMEAVARAAARAQRPAPLAEERRHHFAEEIARMAAGTKPPPLEVTRFVANHFGVVEPEPALYVLTGATRHEGGAIAQYDAALPRFFQHGGWNRVGVGVMRQEREMVIVLALWEQRLELRPLPRALPSGGSTLLQARLLGDLRKPQLVVTNPAGVVRGIPLVQKGAELEAKLACVAGDGRYQVEMLAAEASGPAVLANFPVFCGVEPPNDLAAYDEDEGDEQDPAGAEREMFALINGDRAAAGVPALAWDDRLAAIARAHSRDMASNHFVAHVSPTTGDAGARVKRAGLQATLVTENVGEAYGARQAHAGFMASPGHRANVINPQLTRLGIGVVVPREGRGASLFITQLFTTGL
jgi:uncharacterized protein YkwD